MTSPLVSLAAQASGLTLALTRLTYDARFTTTAEAIVVRDSDGIRILSAGRVGIGDDDDEKRAGKSNTVGVDDVEGATGASKKSISVKMSASRLKRHQARKGQERDTTSAREKIEAAAATLAENQKKETSALLVSFMACDKRYRGETMIKRPRLFVCCLLTPLARCSQDRRPGRLFNIVMSCHACLPSCIFKRHRLIDVK